MSQTLPPARRRPLIVTSVIVIAVALAACSSSPSSGSSSTVPASASPSPSTAISGSPSPSASIHLTVGVDLPSTWVTSALAETGEGYGMTLAATSDPDLFDGHFFRRESDGAVTDQHVITLFVTSRTRVEVTWPDGTTQPGTLSLEADGSEWTEIGLDPGCVGFLAPGGTSADCVLVPESDTVATSSPDSLDIPSQDEAMGYLCSVDVDELSAVVSSSSDPYSTSILQAALTSLGYDPGPIDGRYGRASQDAVREFQADAGIAVDAQVGPQTWTSLQSAACHLPEDPAQPQD